MHFKRLFIQISSHGPVRFTLAISFLLYVRSEHCQSNQMTDHCHNVEKVETSEGQAQVENGRIGQLETDNSLAVVLYREEDVLPLNKRQRSFRYCQHDINIVQNWSGLGVAAVVWDAAEVLAEYLETNPGIVKDKSVIELGAGTGLVGIVAALLGARVTITDREEVIDYLRKTVETNLPTDYLEDTDVVALDWTKDINIDKPLFDVILGADIVYIEEVFEDLLKTLIVLCRPNTVIYLSCRIRYKRDNNFLDKLEESFVVTKILYDKTKDVNLFKVIKR
ncbi:Methyltransferase-like protein 21A [Mactra antiquata]